MSIDAHLIQQTFSIVIQAQQQTVTRIRENETLVLHVVLNRCPGSDYPGGGEPKGQKPSIAKRSPTLESFAMVKLSRQSMIVIDARKLTGRQATYITDEKRTLALPMSTCLIRRAMRKVMVVVLVCYWLDALTLAGEARSITDSETDERAKMQVIGDPGRAARYGLKAGMNLPGSSIKSFVLSLGPVEE